VLFAQSTKTGILCGQVLLAVLLFVLSTLVDTTCCSGCILLIDYFYCWFVGGLLGGFFLDLRFFVVDLGDFLFELGAIFLELGDFILNLVDLILDIIFC